MMKRTMLVLITLGLTHGLLAQKNNKFTYEGRTQVAYGHDNNVFRSPPEYRPPNTPADSLRDPRQKDNFIYFETRQKFQKFFTRKHRLTFILDGQVLRFSQFPEYSEYDFEGHLKYRLKPWKISAFFFSTGVRRAHKRLFNVLGQGLARLFTFTDLSVAHWQRWRPVKFLVITPEVSFINRDYVEIPNRMSLDNTRLTFNAKFQIMPDKKGYHQLFIRPYMQYRDYKGWIVKDAQGNRLPTYPLRKYTYKGFEAGYQLDMDFLTITLSYYQESRRDNFQQWYGYDESGFLASIFYEADKFLVYLYSAVRNRDWLQKRGYLLDRSRPPLFWKRFKVGGEIAFFPVWWLGTYVNMTYLSRNTNVEVPFKKVNRPYKALIVHAGVYIRFDTEAKKNRK